MRLPPFRVAVLVLAIPTVTHTLLAQDEPKDIGGFQTQGFLTTGYRFVDTHGYEPKYDELFDLNGGFRLLDIGVYGHAKADTNSFADDYSLTASGFGGDPFTTTQFTLRKTGLYDLRASFLQSRYYWNRNDNVTSNGFTAITSNHDWATVRKLGAFDFNIHATAQSAVQHRVFAQHA